LVKQNKKYFYWSKKLEKKKRPKAGEAWIFWRNQNHWKSLESYKCNVHKVDIYCNIKTFDPKSQLSPYPLIPLSHPITLVIDFYAECRAATPPKSLSNLAVER
jgi:hypothetical protein